MNGWEPVIGLEIHVHLKTRTKMFCRCEAGFGAEPNTRTCPVCLAHPGTLPVANRTAVEWTIKLGLALGCEIARRFGTGSAPGSPRQTGHTRVFGGIPNQRAEQEQNIFESVPSSTWVSMPMTISYGRSVVTFMASSSRSARACARSSRSPR